MAAAYHLISGPFSRKVAPGPLATSKFARINSDHHIAHPANGSFGQTIATTAAGFLLSALLGTPTLIAAPAPGIVRLEVVPPSIELHGPSSFHGLLVSGVTRDGHFTDLTTQATIKSDAPEVIIIASNHLCQAVGNGEAQVLVEFAGKTASVAVSVSEARQPRTVSFRRDIEPILTRAGCNMGSCHGKLAGQNGFKLSLRGYAPELDIIALTTDVMGRRIDPAFAESSLLIQKALGQVPHEGRQRFAENSRYHRTLLDWIAARAPGPQTNEAEVVGLELLPGSRELQLGESQQLLARARDADGRVRDVTWLAQFFSNDENTASVTPDGLVQARRYGETTVRAHFQGLVAVVTLTIPYENKVPASQFADRFNAIDDAVFAKLAALRLPPSELCDDATFYRRISLDLTGTLPSPERVRAFANDWRRDRRTRLIDALLASPEFVDYWTLQVADLLQNRRERDHDVRGVKGVRAFHQWLRGEVATNRPWNALAREVITASGSVGDHPEIGYFIYNVGEKSQIEESDTPDAVAQSFLGTRIGCARCHNHPLEKYTQDDFYHFAAFFSKVQMKRFEPDKGVTVLRIGTREEDEQRKRLADAEKGWADATNALSKAEGPDLEKARKKVNEQEKRLEDARLQLDKLVRRVPTVTQPRTKRAMAPQPLDHAALKFDAGEDPRERLVAWMTDPGNSFFSGAMVNRLWKHFMGVALVEPVDDLRASNPPSNPALWNLLNKEFVASGYDLRRLMRLILTSRTYQLTAATRHGNEQDGRFYSHYFARRLPAEVLLDAIASATGVPDEFKGYPIGTHAVQLPEPGVGSYFLTLFGRSDRVTACACERSGAVTLPQLLHLQNGDAVLKKIQAEDGRLAALLKRSRSDREIIEQLFMSTLSRKPSGGEFKAVQAALGTGDHTEALRDLFWALLNSKEFAFNH